MDSFCLKLIHGASRFSVIPKSALEEGLRIKKSDNRCLKNLIITGNIFLQLSFITYFDRMKPT